MPNLLHSGGEESLQVSGKHKQRRWYGYLILLTVQLFGSRSFDKRAMLSVDFSSLEQRHLHLEVITVYDLRSRPVLRMAD